MAEFVTVAKQDDVPVGQFKEVVVRGKPLLVCHTATGFYAVDNTCTHDDGPLGDGWLDGCAIECPRHGARFDVRTGEVLALPAAVPIRSYPVQIDGNEIKADLG
ncbi:MAG: non-heme iron oxygenase ferredoxin subunit [Candidatus Omnitrophica bacterium]|nr:non-heme iron oxygenase ferredoxin subunit [Candidatus Omnitrophota bacterium]